MRSEIMTGEALGGESYRKINEKMGETAPLPVDELSISELNTRSCCIDVRHVEYLAARIRERGFHPKRAISVNMITDAGGNVLHRRVAAGVHRLEAAKLAGLREISALLYYNLKEDEECILDKWDNEMDEDHKPVDFLEEAEHCKYLLETKAWSQRKIAKNKGISRKLVYNRIQIANIPEEAKQLLRGGGEHARHFMERYFEDICKLSDPHIIAICGEIAIRGEQAARGEVDRHGHPLHPMRQSEIKVRVGELLKVEKEMEKEGKGLKRERIPLPVQVELFPDESEEPEEEWYETQTVVFDLKREECSPAEPVPPPQLPKPIPELPREIAYRNPEKITKGMNFDRCVRWFKFMGLLKEKGSAFYIVLKKLIEYDIWYRSNDDKPFYFSEKEYEDPIALFAKEACVEKEHILKRILPSIKTEGLINYWMESGLYRFKLNWDGLFELYCKKTYDIPYKEDGLKSLPANFTGIVRPTPFHYLRVENGKVLPWDGGQEAAASAREKKSVPPGGQLPQACGEDNDPIAKVLRGLRPAMDESGVIFCLDKLNETETALKLLKEMAPEKRKRIKNEAAYILELVRKGPQVPKGFVTPQEGRELIEKMKQEEIFLKSFRAAKCTHFVRNGKEYEITSLYNDQGFVIRREDGPHYVRFDDWADMKYFR